MTDYRDPRTVIGQKRHISNVQVIYDSGPNDCAVARLDWDGEPGVGIRWNGNAGDQPLGSSQSLGSPFLFRIPDDFADVILRHARELAPETEPDAAYREMASDTEREQAATEWSQALIGDVANASR